MTDHINMTEVSTALSFMAIAKVVIIGAMLIFPMAYLILWTPHPAEVPTGTGWEIIKDGRG